MSEDNINKEINTPVNLQNNSLNKDNEQEIKKKKEKKTKSKEI